MRLLRGHAKNFCSYPSIDFNYQNLGLSLISGPTKAGKSTLLDLACWTLFGRTSKDLAADDVRSWFSEEPTIGIVLVETASGTIEVTRIRGNKPSQNDLYLSEVASGDMSPIRGKDLADTQKFIEQRLGVNADLYIAASYIHQFTSDKFFTSKAKDRREMMEKISDLSFPILLGDRLLDHKKGLKEEIKLILTNKARIEGQLELASHNLADLVTRYDEFETDKKNNISKLEMKQKDYAQDKQNQIMQIVDQLEALDKMIQPKDHMDQKVEQLRGQLKASHNIIQAHKVAGNEIFIIRRTIDQKKSEYDKYSTPNGEACPVCLGPSNNPNKKQHLEELFKDITKLENQLQDMQTQFDKLDEVVNMKPSIQERLNQAVTDAHDNTRLIDKFEALQLKAITLREEKNPYETQLAQILLQDNPYKANRSINENQVTAYKDNLKKTNTILQELEQRLSSIEWLYDKSLELRGLKLTNAIQQINNKTNEILERFFDATIRVRLSLEDGDKLEVDITNEGYDCKYAQLSGGERAMLKLAFSTGYMQAAEDSAGIKFSTLMLDEAMNGLDDALKVKAFSLLESLHTSYETILLVDHSDALKQKFVRSFIVSKDGAHSSVTDSID